MPKALRHAVHLLVAALVATASPARAGATPASKAPRSEGGRLLRAKQYDAAIAAYERALALGADSTTLYELAQAHRGAGHPEKALLYLQLFARLSPRSPLRFMAKTQMAQLEAELAQRAGPPLESEAVARPEAAPGGSTGSTGPSEIAVRITPPELAAPAPAEPAATAAPAPGAPALASATQAAASVAATPRDERPAAEIVAPPAVTEAPRSARGRAPAEIAAAALIIGGSALIGAGAGATIWGKVTEGRTEQALAPNPSIDDQAHLQSTAGAVCAIGGVMAALIGGGILWRQRAPQISVAPTAGGAQASIGLRF